MNALLVLLAAAVFVLAYVDMAAFRTALWYAACSRGATFRPEGVL